MPKMAKDREGHWLSPGPRGFDHYFIYFHNFLKVTADKEQSLDLNPGLSPWHQPVWGIASLNHLWKSWVFEFFFF